MSDGGETQILPTLVLRDPRVHLLDDSWLLTIFAVLFAIAVPWLVSGLAIDLIPAASGLIVLGAIHVTLVVLGREEEAGLRPGRGLALLHALGIVAMAYVWLHAGALQNPLFLLVFVLPVIGAIFLSRWQPYAMAALAAVAVALVAALKAPELRWYAPGVSAAVGWLDGLLGRAPGGSAPPFAGFYAPSEYFVVLLEVFVIVLFACAIAADYLGTVYERLHAQVSAARAEAERGQRLWSGLLEQLPLPAFLVDASTFEVCLASSMAQKEFANDSGFLGRSLFDVLAFSYPEVVHELINGAGGIAPVCMLRHAERLLATEVRVQHLAQRGRRFALVMVTDRTEAFCVRAALDVAEHAALVVDAHGAVLASNKPAGALFPGVAAGSELAALLPQPEREARWWEPGLSGRRKMHVTIRQRVYQMTSSAIALSGEREQLYVLAFVPAAQVPAASSDQSGRYTQLVSRP
jgi:hypothetical protein